MATRNCPRCDNELIIMKSDSKSKSRIGWRWYCEDCNIFYPYNFGSNTEW